MAAVVKCNVRRHINEKCNVECSQEFVDAAKRTKYLSIFASKIEPHSTTNKNATSTTKIDWTGVTMFTNLQYQMKVSKPKSAIKQSKISSQQFDEIEITAWRSYNIGDGKKFIWSNLSTVQNIDQLVVTYHKPSVTQQNWMNENTEEDDDNNYYSNDDAEEEKAEDNNTNDTKKKNPESAVFDCPDANCIRQFRRHANLQAHLTTGAHKYQPNRLQLLDKAKLYYQEQLETDKIERIYSIKNFQVIYNSNQVVNYQLKQGWALYNRKPKTSFSDYQVAYLTEKYMEGERDGLKWNPSRLAEHMQTAVINGQYLFEPSDWLTSTQIKSFFARLTKKKRQNSQTNEEEENEEISEDDESLTHAKLLQESINLLGDKENKTSKQQQQQKGYTQSPSTIRKMNDRSNDDLSTLHLEKRTLTKKK